MRVYPPILCAASGIVLTLAMTGCGASDNEGTLPTATAGSSGAQVVLGNTINYGSFGTTAAIDCGDGKSLTIGGSNNTLTVTGRCATAQIGGADNKISFDTIDGELNVVGLNNAVTYKAGEPKVNDLGSGNSINKG